jgi:hypothetical protein
MDTAVNNINGVSDIKILPAQDFDTLVERFVSIEWPVAANQVDALLAAWQWQIDERVDENGIVIDAGYGFNRRDPGWVHLGDGEVTSVSVGISDKSGEKVAPSALRDAFAEHTASVVARLGKPSERKAGDKPLAVWMLPSDSRLVLYCAGVGNTLEVTSPEQGRIRRDMR